MNFSQLRVEPTSSQSANVTPDLVLWETNTTRLVLRAALVNPHDSEAGTHVFLIHQRKGSTSVWEDYPTWSLSQVKAGEQVKLELRSGAVKNLLKSLQKLAKLHEEYYQDEWRAIGGAEPASFAVIESNGSNADALRALLSSGDRKEILRTLSENTPAEILTKLALGSIQQVRMNAIRRFEEMMQDASLGEDAWQKFFQDHTWIFGYGLRYQFLSLAAPQPIYRGPNVHNQGAQRGDYLMATEAEIRFTVLVEIKKPTSSLFQGGEYRNGVWRLAPELVGAVSQVQANCQTWAQSALQSENADDLRRDGIFTREPKGILVIGCTEQFADDTAEAKTKRNTFESFRRNLHNPEVLTFDEVMARAKFIVDHCAADNGAGVSASPETVMIEDDFECPF